jgi:hypothetical protein
VGEDDQMPRPPTIGQPLRAERTQRGMSQREAAEDLGTSQASSNAGKARGPSLGPSTAGPSSTGWGSTALTATGPSSQHGWLSLTAAAGEPLDAGRPGAIDRRRAQSAEGDVGRSERSNRITGATGP